MVLLKNNCCTWIGKKMVTIISHIKNELSSEENKQQSRLKEVLEHHIALGVEAIFSGVFMGNKPEQVSFHHLLNRAMMVGQGPITFVIFRLENQQYQFVCTTNKHRNGDHQEQIRKQSAVCVQAHEDYLIPLWINEEKYHKKYESGVYKKYFIAVLNADTDQFDPIKKITEIQFVKTVWEAISYKLCAIFQEEKYRSYDEDFHAILIKSIENFLVNPENEQLKPQKVSLNVKKNFYTDLLVNNTDYDFQGKGVIDRVFDKLEKSISSISMRGNQEKVTNFFLYVRDYDDSILNGKKRYNEYDYNIRIAIGSSQATDLKNHLLKWKSKEGNNDLEKKYLDSLKSKKFPKEIKILATSASNYFWKKVFSEGQSEDDPDVPNKKITGCEWLIKNMGQPFGNNTRSIADPVLEGGVSFYRAPFSNDAGMGRSIPRKGKPDCAFNELNKDVQNDLIRVITFNYLLDSMAMNSVHNNTELRVMLNPIELGGRVWAAVSYVTRSFPLTSKIEEIDIEEYNLFWLQNYHIYYDVNERMKRNIRTYMNRLYEATIASEYVNWVGSLAQKKARGEDVDIRELVKSFNNKLSELTCLFPYDAIRMRLDWTEVDKPRPSTGVCQAYLAKNIVAIPEVVCESHFPEAPGNNAGRHFVDPDDLAIAMTDRILRTILDIQSKTNYQ